MSKTSAYSVALVPTKITILKPADPAARRRSREALADGEFPDGETLRGFLRGFLDAHLGTATMDTDSLSGFRIASLAGKKSGYGQLHGYVETGKYGFESELVDVNDTNKKKKRERTDCELVPFFFAADFERGKNCAILLTEQFGPYSPKGILLERLRAHVRDRLPGHTVSTESIVSDDIVQEVLSRRVKALRFQYDRVPSDLADAIDGTVDGSHVEMEGRMEVVIKPRCGTFIQWGAEQIRNLRRTGLTILDETSAELKVDMEVDGRTKTVNVGNTDSFNASFAVDSLGEVQQNGHPSEERMVSEAEDAFRVCRRTLGWPSRQGRGTMAPNREEKE